MNVSWKAMRSNRVLPEWRCRFLPCVLEIRFTWARVLLLLCICHHPFMYLSSWQSKDICSINTNRFKLQTVVLIMFIFVFSASYVYLLVIWSISKAYLVGGLNLSNNRSVYIAHPPSMIRSWRSVFHLPLRSSLLAVDVTDCPFLGGSHSGGLTSDCIGSNTLASTGQSHSLLWSHRGLFFSRWWNRSPMNYRKYWGNTCHTVWTLSLVPLSSSQIEPWHTSICRLWTTWLGHDPVRPAVQHAKCRTLSSWHIHKACLGAGDVL